MLSNIQSILETYANTYNAATSDMGSKRTDIRCRYSEEFAQPEYKKLSEEYEEKIKSARENALKSIETEFTEAEKTLLDCSTENVPEDFAEKYKLLKDVSIDENEFRPLVEKYKNNYDAAKLLNKLAEQNGLMLKVITVTDKLKEFNKLRDKCNKFIKTYSGINKSYENENLLRGNIISSCIEYVEQNIVER